MGCFLPHRTQFCERYTLICMGLPPEALSWKVVNWKDLVSYRIVSRVPFSWTLRFPASGYMVYSCLTIFCHSFRLLLANSIASYMVSKPISLSCFLTISSQVVCGLPFGFFFAGLSASYRACFAGQFSGNLLKCPNQLILLFFTFSDHFLARVLSYNSSFETLTIWYWVFFLVDFFEKRLFLVRFFLVVVHTSQLYRKILSISALWIRNFVSNEMSLFLYMSFTDIYDWFAKDFLLLISCCVSSRLRTYLHVFHWFDPFLSTVYFSVFDSFTSRFLSSVFGVQYFLFLQLPRYLCLPILYHPRIVGRWLYVHLFFWNTYDLVGDYCFLSKYSKISLSIIHLSGGDKSKIVRRFLG